LRRALSGTALNTVQARKYFERYAAYRAHLLDLLDQRFGHYRIGGTIGGIAVSPIVEETLSVPFSVSPIVFSRSFRHFHPSSNDMDRPEERSMGYTVSPPGP
jgi:hypothetical protein